MRLLISEGKLVRIVTSHEGGKPVTKKLFQIIGAIAQWERSLIAERVKAGLHHARNQGKSLGRPPIRKLTPPQVAALRRERLKNKSPFRTLASKFGISLWTAHKLCGRHTSKSER
jgi:DNA invertase Pin-like site-specific DNA recombinase